MFELITRLVLHKQLVWGEGYVKLLNQNVVIFPFSNLLDLIRLIETSKQKKHIYLSAKKLGKEWIESLFKAYKMDTIKDQAKWGENVFTLAGFGKMQVVSWDIDKKEMIYRVHNSVIANAYGKIGKVVDVIPAGWFAGASSVFFNSDVDCVEVKCLSKGDNICEFLTATKAELKKRKLI